MKNLDTGASGWYLGAGTEQGLPPQGSTSHLRLSSCVGQVSRHLRTAAGAPTCAQDDSFIVLRPRCPARVRVRGGGGCVCVCGGVTGAMTPNEALSPGWKNPTTQSPSLPSLQPRVVAVRPCPGSSSLVPRPPPPPPPGCLLARVNKGPPRFPPHTWVDIPRRLRSLSGSLTAPRQRTRPSPGAQWKLFR